MTREAKRGAGQDEEEEEDGLSERVQINRSIQSWCPLTRLVTAGDVLLNCLRQSLKGCRECVSRVYNSVVHTIHDVVRLTFCPPGRESKLWKQIKSQSCVDEIHNILRWIRT